jgi:hypothetical protein
LSQFIRLKDADQIRFEFYEVNGEIKIDLCCVKTDLAHLYFDAVLAHNVRLGAILRSNYFQPGSRVSRIIVTIPVVGPGSSRLNPNLTEIIIERGEQRQNRPDAFIDVAPRRLEQGIIEQPIGIRERSRRARQVAESMKLNGGSAIDIKNMLKLSYYLEFSRGTIGSEVFESLLADPTFLAEQLRAYRGQVQEKNSTNGDIKLDQNEVFRPIFVPESQVLVLEAIRLEWNKYCANQVTKLKQNEFSNLINEVAGNYKRSLYTFDADFIKLIDRLVSIQTTSEAYKPWDILRNLKGLLKDLKEARSAKRTISTSSQPGAQERLNRFTELGRR